ncbi:MAG TPA: undecaprenyl-diphosphate phosphatase [Acidimicrobiia bacterium]
MSTLHAIILGIAQGLSEFLPISSSGHLLFIPDLFGWNDFNGNDSLEKAFDVALHVGTLVAAIWYFREDLWEYLVAALRSIRVRAVDSVDARLAWLLLLSAVPGAIIGALLSSTIEDELGDPILIGVNLIVFGLVLEWADHAAPKRESDDFHARDATIMGIAQAVALAPGVSRSGVTISAGRWLRFDRVAATRLSFLMSIPIIGGAALYKGAELARDGLPSGFANAFLAGMVAAAISGWVAIAFLLRFVRTHTFRPFVIYRCVVGTLLIVVFATGVR